METTIFTTRDDFTETLRKRFIIDGMPGDAVTDTLGAIAEFETAMLANPTEGARIYSDFLDVTVTVTAYADLAREAVKVGAEALDMVRGDDWRALINRDTLDVSSLKDCLIGQLYGDYDEGFSTIRDLAESRELELPNEWCEAFRGCSSNNPHICCPATVPMSVMTLAWREYLSSAVPAVTVKPWMDLAHAVPVGDPILDLINESE